MVKFPIPGMRVKCIAGERKQYGRVGTVRLYKEGLVKVEFDDESEDKFRREELRMVKKFGRGA